MRTSLAIAARRSAFTLLEVLLAMSIFGLVTVGVVMTFRTAATTYERSEGLMQSLQITRAVGDTLGADLRSAFLVDENTYGTPLAEGEQQEIVVTQVVSSLVDERRDLEDEDYVRDPTIALDMDFIVEDGGEFDTVRMVRRLWRADSRRGVPWGLARLTYRVVDQGEDGGKVLIREVRPLYYEMPEVLVYEDETTEEARRRTEEESERLEPYVELLASGVELFDVNCIFWADEEWRSVEEWDSREKQTRNPYQLGELDVDDVNYNAMRQAREQLPEDGLPSALDVQLGIVPKGTARLGVSRLVIPLFAAQETWIPGNQNLLDDLGGDSGEFNSSSRSSRTGGGSQML